MNLFGNNYSKQEVMKRIGDISAITGVKRYKMEGGMATGVHVASVRNVQGLDFTVLLDRGMDIAQCDYKGIPMAYVSKTGFTSPFLCEHRGTEFLRNFGAGMLTTCGYLHFGNPCNNQEEELSLHGRATGLIADQVGAYGEWVDDDYVMTIRGEMRQSRVFGENIKLTRQITCKAGEDKLHIQDTFENCGFEEQPFMLLYHCNFGYPIVSEHTQLLTSGSKKVTPRNAHAKEHEKSYKDFSAPVHGYEECVYYHDLKEQGSQVWAGLYHQELGIGGYIRYSKKELPIMVEWKMVGEGEYVCGLEAGTWYCDGQAAAREKGELDKIQPGEVKQFHLEIGSLTPENIHAFR